VRLDLKLWQREFGATVSVFAQGAASGGTASAMTQVGTAVPLIIAPHAELGAVVPAPPGLAGGRAEYIGVDAGTATIGLGCELRDSSGTYTVEGTADWRANRVLALSKVANTFTTVSTVDSRPAHKLNLKSWQRDYGATVDIYVQGTVSGGTASNLAQVGTAVPMVIVPLGSDGRITAAPFGLADGRANYFGLDMGTARFGLGAELRATGGTYVVESVADWRMGRVAGLSKVVTPYTQSGGASPFALLDMSGAPLLDMSGAALLDMAG
jgi:hypothetical protein